MNSEDWRRNFMRGRERETFQPRMRFSVHARGTFPNVPENLFIKKFLPSHKFG